MEIITYRSEYKNDFIRLNLAWIERYYKIEQADADTLKNIEEHIKNGAMVYFAVEDGKVMAACMAEPRGNSIWEICKLASDGQYTGRGGEAPFLKPA